MLEINEIPDIYATLGGGGGGGVGSVQILVYTHTTG